MRERDIERYLSQEVLAKGGIAYKFVSPQRRGVPDRVVLFPGGWLIWVELKAPGKTPEPHQLREHERMRKMGQRVAVIDSFEGVDLLCG